MRVKSSSDGNSGLMPQLAAVYVGGGVGTLLRLALSEAIPVDPASWPWHTFVANVLACALLSFAIAQRETGWGSETRLALVGSGLCGGLSTFSTLQLEIYEMVDAGSYLLALSYLAVSVAVGLGLVSVARRFVARGADVA